MSGCRDRCLGHAEQMYLQDSKTDAMIPGNRLGQGEAIPSLAVRQGMLESVLSMMQLEHEMLLVAVCKLLL